MIIIPSFIIFVAFVVSLAACYESYVESLVKCCDQDYLTRCTIAQDINVTVYDSLDVCNNTAIVNITCLENNECGSYDAINVTANSETMCLHVSENGTTIFQCEERYHCDSVFTPLKFWGATIVVFANAVYIVPYIIVMTFYYVIRDLHHRAYDKAVLCYNIEQFILNCLLIGAGLSILCHSNNAPEIYAPLGLALMFLTISSVFWLCVICFDMTLLITRFRWAPSAARDTKAREFEQRKFRIYSIWVWVGTVVPTAIAAVIELTPIVPADSVIRPNFQKFDDGANLAVIVYVATLPFFACFVNSMLFIYTTYKIIIMRKSTAIANENRVKNASQRYFVYLRLYLLMDAPWISSILAATFSDLWILKLFRMIQPILMLLAILPRETLNRIFKCKRKDDKSPCNHERGGKKTFL